jgi:hypothetical protein
MLRPTIPALACGVILLLLGSGAAGQVQQEPAEPTATAPPPNVIVVRPTTQPSPPPDAYVVRPVPIGPPPSPRTSFTFSAGWASLNSSGGDSMLDEVDGYYFDTEFSFRLKADSPLWLGVSFNGSYFDEEHDVVVDTGVFPTEAEVDAAISTFCIEPRLTFLLLPRRDKGPYLAAKLGAGLLIADYWATSIVERPAGFFVDSEGDTTLAFEVRPGLQLGYSGGPWVVGAEVSEMWAWGDFNAIGDELNELRVGVFFTMRY